MVIETQRLLIHIASQEEMVRFIEQQTDEILITAYREMLQGCLDHPDQWDWYAIWFIEHNKGLHADGSVEIGYGISEEHQGKGFATEAVEAAVTWALHQPGVCRVEAETEPENKASQRVLAKCGFVPAGILGEEGPRFFKQL